MYEKKKRCRRKKSEFEEAKQKALESFKCLDENVRNDIWSAFYDSQSRLNKLIRNTVYYLLESNNLLHYYRDVLDSVIFRVFTLFVVRLIEGKHSPDFLEKTAIYNARHFAIEEIIKLKRMVRITDENEDEYQTEDDIKMIKLEREIEKKWNKIIQDVADIELISFLQQLKEQSDEIIVKMSVLSKLSKYLKIQRRKLKNLLANMYDIKIR